MPTQAEAGRSRCLAGAWQGIGDALAAGDIAGAAKILWLTLKMEWQKGVNALTEFWVGFKQLFLDLATKAFYGLAAWLGDLTAGKLRVRMSHVSASWRRYRSTAFGHAPNPPAGPDDLWHGAWADVAATTAGQQTIDELHDITSTGPYWRWMYVGDESEYGSEEEFYIIAADRPGSQAIQIVLTEGLLTPIDH